MVKIIFFFVLFTRNKYLLHLYSYIEILRGYNMYALVKTSNKYDVIQKAKIRKNNKRIYSSWQKKLNNADRALLACNGKWFVVTFIYKL